MKRYIFIIGFSLAIISCGQEREKKPEQPGHAQMDHKMSGDELHLSDLQIQLGNIRVDSVTEHTLGGEFLINGIVAVNQSRAFSIATRVMGRIEKLYVKNTGDVVREGDLLYEIYSEELNTAIHELLLLNGKIKVLKNDLVDMARIREGAINKLKLYGLTDEQIKNIEIGDKPVHTVKIFCRSGGVVTRVDAKEGDYLMKGTSLYQMADLGTLWVEGQVYSSYLNAVKKGMAVSVSFPGYADKEYREEISFISPELNPASKINSIRIEIENKDLSLKPGLQAYVRILTSHVKALSVPTDAIIRDSKGATVWIKTGENRFKNKRVTIGKEANSYTEIKNGLERGDLVVVGGAYLLNSEYIFKNGMSPMEGHDMSKM